MSDQQQQADNTAAVQPAPVVPALQNNGQADDLTDRIRKHPAAEAPPPPIGKRPANRGRQPRTEA